MNEFMNFRSLKLAQVQHRSRHIRGRLHQTHVAHTDLISWSQRVNFCLCNVNHWCTSTGPILMGMRRLYFDCLGVDLFRPIMAPNSTHAPLRPILPVQSLWKYQKKTWPMRLVKLCFTLGLRSAQKQCPDNWVFYVQIIRKKYEEYRRLLWCVGHSQHFPEIPAARNLFNVFTKLNKLRRFSPYYHQSPCVWRIQELLSCRGHSGYLPEIPAAPHSVRFKNTPVSFIRLKLVRLSCFWREGRCQSNWSEWTFLGRSAQSIIWSVLFSKSEFMWPCKSPLLLKKINKSYDGTKKCQPVWAAVFCWVDVSLVTGEFLKAQACADLACVVAWTHEARLKIKNRYLLGPTFLLLDVKFQRLSQQL